MAATVTPTTSTGSDSAVPGSAESRPAVNSTLSPGRKKPTRMPVSTKTKENSTT